MNLKKYLLPVKSLLLIATLAITACSGDGNESNGSNCEDVTVINVSQAADELNINVAAASALYYEISLVNTINGTNPNSGNIVQLNDTTGTIDISMYQSGNYVIYARTVCGDGEFGDWFGPKPLTIAPFCSTPTDLNVFLGTFHWQYPFSDSASSNYQVQYGLQGFALGSGTMATVNDESYSGAALVEGNSYDFYVRAYCTNNVGYGNWSGPFTYFATSSQNICAAPSNITKTVSNLGNNMRQISLNWNGNGENSFEYTMVDHNDPVNSGDMYASASAGATYTATGGYTYDFYVRAVCDNGNKTAWTKLVIEL